MMKWDWEIKLLSHMYFASEKKQICSVLQNLNNRKEKIFLFPHSLSHSKGGYEPTNTLSMKPAAEWILFF